MAAQSPQDAVNQLESVDALSPTDVPALKTNDPAALAAASAEVEPIDKLTINAAEHGSDILAAKGTVPQNADAHERNKTVQQDNEVILTGPPALDLPSNKDETAVDMGSSVNESMNGIFESSELRDPELAEDASVRGPGIDGSLGSDTDTSKTDAAGSAKDAIPRYSVRKSATFKPVSVTKNLLAKTTAVSTPTKTTGDKAPLLPGSPASASAQPVARPRLVAKTGSGQRSSTPKLSGMTNKNGKGAAPDPSQVWNRNRVTTAPQATPKHLTDEELRQQYGIQLASRPQEDGDGKEAKWADIDDDEDDWAPETIEWNDGTKINLSQMEPTPSKPEALGEPVKREEKRIEGGSAKYASSKPTSVGPNATVLKLGSAAQSKTTPTMAQKPSEKPTLVSKPAAPVPVKSPWATLPAVDKVPPVEINPPVQPPLLRSQFAQRNMHGFDAMPPPPAPHTKEIAADDFSRLAREGPSSGPRELYNSQSGRYEPVNDARRQSVRKDGNFRQPSVLQRPSPTDTHGPAEPSPAFQTSQWGRRRGSSNVSGESGKLGQRIATGRGYDNKTPDQGHDRRGSQGEFLQNSVPLSTGHRLSISDASPVVSHGEPLTPQLPPGPQSPYVASGGAQQFKPTGVVPEAPGQGLPNEDAIALQKRLMREKREAAIKRRQEEEAKEETERRERIRLRMEKAGLLDKAAEKAGDKPVDKSAEADRKTAPAAASKKFDKMEVQAQPQNHSPPKPPAPSATGQPQQYGLMKLHAPQPAANHTVLEQAGQHQATAGPIERRVESTYDRLAAKLNGETLIENQPENDESGVDSLKKGVPSDARSGWPAAQAQQAPQQQQAPPSTTFAAWNNNTAGARTSPSGTLWGPPSNHKALGNGDFNNNIQLSQMRQSAQQPPYQQHLISPQPPPHPIGTPRQAQPQQQRAETSNNKALDYSSRSFVEDSQTIPAFPPETGGSKHQQPLHALISEQSSSKHTHSGANTMNLPQDASDQPKTGVAAWHQFAANAAKDDAERFERAKREMDARLEQQRQSGHKPVFNETWKKVATTPGSFDTRRVVDASQSQHQRGYPGSEAKITAPSQPTQHVRSRYQDLFDQSPGPHRSVSMPVGLVRPGSPSPPPPDSSDHPAYDSITDKPLVKLPSSRDCDDEQPAKPVVRLPPAAAAPAPSQSVDVPQQRANASATRHVSQPPASSAVSWQDRINGLLDRKTPPKPVDATAPLSASKVPLDLPKAGAPATSSVTKRKFSVLPDVPVPSLEDVEALFEEPKEMGSVPTVRVPTTVPPAIRFPAKTPYVNHKRARFYALRDRDVETVDTFLIRDHGGHGKLGSIRIFLQGMSGPHIKHPARKDGGTHSRGPRNYHGSMKGKPRGGQKRDNAGSHANVGAQKQQQQPHSAGPTHAPAPLPKPQPKARTETVDISNTGPGSWARNAPEVTI